MPKKILVVYFSRSGHTQAVAEDLASRLHADLEKIIDKTKRKGFLGFIFGGRDALKEKLTLIEEIKKNPAEYDIIIIGTPVWAGNITPAVRTYILWNKNSFKRTVCFWTSGSDEPGMIHEKIQKIIPAGLMGFIGFSRKELKPANKNKYEEKMINFISKFKGILKNSV